MFEPNSGLVKKSKAIFLVAIMWFAFGRLMGQEFWMEPDKFVYPAGVVSAIKFNLGSDFASDTWNLRAGRVKKLSLYAGVSNPVDVKDRLREGTGDHLHVSTTTPGSYMLVMESEPSLVELPAEKFNKYLKDYALDRAYSSREQNGKLDEIGKELYSRNTKLFIQVGDKRTDNYKVKTGLPLDIIPESNPADFKVGDRITFKLLFNGKPVFGAKAFVWNRKDSRTYTQPVYSQEDGSFEVRIFNDGKWMVSVVYMEPSDNPQAAWRSYWGSCVFSVGEIVQEAPSQNSPAKTVRD